MAHDQFNIPGRPLQEALHIADSFQYSPERQPGAYERIKMAEERIHGYRRTALEIEKGRKPGLLESMVGVKRQKVTLESLVEAESRIGGELFGPNDRLWLSPKGSSLLSNNNLGDWYHVREEFDAFGRKLSETTLHFETHPSHLNKLHAGRPVELTLQELETLVRAIELYEQRVRERLYPFDQEIFDLLAEIDAEDFIVPDSVEERFGKEIVARVVEAYKMQKEIERTTIPNTPQEMFGEAAVEQIRNDVRTKL